MSVRVFLARWLRRSRTQRAAAALRRIHVGAGSRLATSVQVLGWAHVRIGQNTLICEDTWLNALNCPSDQPAIVVGDHCLLGRRNFLNAGASLILGDYCLTGPDCHFLGSDHRHDSPDAPYVTTGSSMGGEITIETNVWFGARVTVLKGVRIGFGSIVGACSVVTRDVPPFAMVFGNPARVARRFSVPRRAWIAADDFGSIDEAALPSATDYLGSLRRSHPDVRLPKAVIGTEAGDC